MASLRPLHFVFKVGDRTKTATFYREVLGMKFLRHEEFTEGCKATCNGPYDGKWSKSMVGYGAEDDHFVMELTYNYGIGEYKLGNDYQGITIQSKSAIENAKKANWPITQQSDGVYVVEAPGGYKFYLLDEEPNKQDPVQKVTLGVSDLDKSVDYWNKLCGFEIYNKSDKAATLGVSKEHCQLELKHVGDKVDHASAFGRVAFSCPSEQLAGIESKMKDAGENILTPLVSLDTPGKATVQVVILADPDGHEICFVGDEAFRQLSKVDPKANETLNQAIEADKSTEWFIKHKKQKLVAT